MVFNAAICGRGSIHLILCPGKLGKPLAKATAQRSRQNIRRQSFCGCCAPCGGNWTRKNFAPPVPPPPMKRDGFMASCGWNFQPARAGLFWTEWNAPKTRRAKSRKPASARKSQNEFRRMIRQNPAGFHSRKSKMQESTKLGDYPFMPRSLLDFIG